MRAIYCSDKCNRAAQYTRRCESNRQHIKDIKAETPCADCGLFYPYYVMDFDHIADDKVKSIADLIYKSRSRLVAEVKKCELVCANCHRQRTHDRGYMITY